MDLMTIYNGRLYDNMAVNIHTTMNLFSVVVCVPYYTVALFIVYLILLLKFCPRVVYLSASSYLLIAIYIELNNLNHLQNDLNYSDCLTSTNLCDLKTGNIWYDIGILVAAYVYLILKAFS